MNKSQHSPLLHCCSGLKKPPDAGLNMARLINTHHSAASRSMAYLGDDCWVREAQPTHLEEEEERWHM